MSHAERGVFVTILGTKYSVVSDQDETYVRELEAYLNAKLEHFVRGRSAPLLQRVILTALNIADELFRERQKHRELLDEIGRRSETLIDSLNQGEQRELIGVRPKREG